MSTQKDKILERLRKLMNLKESATALGNEGEANAAAAGITRLLMEYNLVESDIPEQEKIDNPIVSEEIPYRTPIEDGPWYSTMVGILCEYNLSRLLFISTRHNSRLKRDRMEIVGRKKNVEVVLYLTSFLANQFVKHGRGKYPQYKYDSILKRGLRPLSERMFMKSFLLGCAYGLASKLQSDKNEIAEKVDITALVKSTTAEIDDFLKGKKIGTARNSKAEIDPLSASMGHEVGQNIEIAKGVCSTVNEERMLQ